MSFDCFLIILSCWILPICSAKSDYALNKF